MRIATILVLAAGLLWTWLRPANDPGTLYEQRCGLCHALPDLSGYRREDMDLLVADMRTRNDAAATISEREASIIVSYLESMASADEGQTGAHLVRGSDARPNPVLQSASEDYVVEVIRDHLDFPSSINFAPDGRLFILERGNLDVSNGARHPPRLKRYDLATDSLETIGVIEDSHILPARQETFNGGALGLEVDPDFATNGMLYVCYHFLTDPNNDRTGRNRLSSFVVRDNKLVDQRILVDRIPGDSVRNGCRVIIGPEGNLYYATGTGRKDRNAQRRNSNAGKILRIRRDGSIPPDNPFPDSPIWTYGHRNPEGLAFDPNTGQLWSTEHGSDTDDELNRIEPGKNYGWPYCGGDAPFDAPWGRQFSWRARTEDVRHTLSRYRSPFRILRYMRAGQQICYGKGLGEKNYSPAVKSFYPNRTVGISDIAFYTGDAFRSWRGNLLLVTLKASSLMRIGIDGDSANIAELLIDGNEASNYGRLRDVTVGPDGFIYVITNVTNPRVAIKVRPKNPRGSLLLRIRPPGEKS